MLRFGLILLFVFSPLALFSQALDTEYYPENEEFNPVVEDEIFVLPTWEMPDPFRGFSRYRFGAVRYRERGIRGRTTLSGNKLSDNVLIALLRRSGLAVEETPAMIAGSIPATLSRSDNFLLRPEATDEFYAIVRAGDRYSRLSSDIRLSRSLSNNWAAHFAATGQVGNDAHMAGLFTDEAGGVASMTKSWKTGAELTIFAAGCLSERGARTAAMTETFELTGNNLYNPLWGWQDGQRRNSRVTRNRNLVIASELTMPIDADRTLSARGMLTLGRRGRTRLAWYDASSPLPDYYRSMPSFFPDGAAAEIVEEAWLAGDEDVRQLDWDFFYYNNTLAEDGQATYIVEEQVVSMQNMNLNVSITRRFRDNVEATYGVRTGHNFSRYYKVADDLLGAQWVANVDQYVTDYQQDEYVTEPPNENDLRNPGRKIRRGERFGYDYTMTRLEPEIFGVVKWQKPTHGLVASATLTHTRLWRNGLTEKELFPGDESFGPSSTLRFTTFSASAAAWHRIGARHSFSLAAFAGSEVPENENLFLSPQQNNFIVTGVTPTGVYGAEASWSYQSDYLDFRLGGFVNSSTNETMVRQYYDDLAQTFADMVVRGIDRLNYGIEAGAEVRPTRWLTLSAGASIGSYRFNNEPVATIFDDSTGEIFSDNATCYLSGLSTGIPGNVAGVEMAYSDRNYLRMSVSGEFFGRRFVEINPLYHSARVIGINRSPEIMEQFTGQERLPDAFTLNVSLSKGWVVGRGFLRVAANVRNLLSNSIIHSAYEQMRIRRLGTGSDRTLVPFPTKYIYSWPTTWSMSISYRL